MPIIRLLAKHHAVGQTLQMTGARIIGTGHSSMAFTAALRSSRVIRFPDGKDRLIALENRLWIVLDKLTAEKNWSPNTLPDLAFRAASEFFTTEHPDFENKLRFGFRHFLKLNMSHVMQELPLKGANDDDFGRALPIMPASRIDLQSIFARAASPTPL